MPLGERRARHRALWSRDRRPGRRLVARALPFDARKAHHARPARPAARRDSARPAGSRRRMRKDLAQPRARARTPRTRRGSAAAASGCRRAPHRGTRRRPTRRSRGSPPTRVVIENVSPEIDGGRFPAKAAVGDCFTVEADIFCRRPRQDRRRAPDPPRRRRGVARSADGLLRQRPLARRRARSRRTRRYDYTIIAWRDLFASWRDEVSKKHAAGLPLALELTEGRDARRGDAATKASARATPTGRRWRRCSPTLDRGGRRRARSPRLMAQETPS